MLLLADFYIVQSAEILHDYHNVPLKNASSVMIATRRDYIKCLSTSYAICKHVTIFSENFPNERRKLSQDVLINYMFHAIRQEKEGLPFVPDDKAFISTYCFLPVWCARARIVHVIITSRTSTPFSLPSSIL